MLLFAQYVDTIVIAFELVLVSLLMTPGQCQEGGFELPVQLIGFPVIIIAVRMSNFVKKLAYSLNPKTYRRTYRSVRGITTQEPPLDLVKADKELARQLGPDFCVYEDICLQHAKSSGTKNQRDWEHIINSYSQLPLNQQQNFLLSVFLGDIIGSASLCGHFAQTGRICD